MALPKPLITAYVALIAVLVYRAIYYPAALPSPPSKSTRRCTFDWRRARCSAGCTFKVMGGCKPTDAAAPPSAPAVDVSQADSLMRKRTVANCLAAADIYEAAAGPEATTGPARQLQLKAADAINCAMRIETHGNIMVLEGTLDTPAAKKFWAAHGQRALNLVRSAKKDSALASEAFLANVEMDAFMYASSAKGIIQQALTGAGNEFLKLANVLVSKHSTQAAAPSSSEPLAHDPQLISSSSHTRARARARGRAAAATWLARLTAAARRPSRTHAVRHAGTTTVPGATIWRASTTSRRGRLATRSARSPR